MERTLDDAMCKRIETWQDEVGNDSLTDWDLLEMAIAIFNDILNPL